MLDDRIDLSWDCFLGTFAADAVATTTSPPTLTAAVRIAVEELETQRTRLREIRDLTLGGRRPLPLKVEEAISHAFLEKVFDSTVDLTVDRLDRVIGHLEEALGDDDRNHLRLV